MALTKQQLKKAQALWEQVAVVHYAQEGDGWAATARHGDIEADGSGRTLTAARASVLTALARKVNEQWWAANPGLDKPRASVIHPGALRAVDVVDLPATTLEKVATALATRDQARVAATEAAEALRAAALALDDAGLSLRDAGHLLELSHARVAQVLDQARTSPGGEG